MVQNLVRRQFSFWPMVTFFDCALHQRQCIECLYFTLFSRVQQCSLTYFWWEEKLQLKFEKGVKSCKRHKEEGQELPSNVILITSQVCPTVENHQVTICLPDSDHNELQDKIPEEESGPYLLQGGVTCGSRGGEWEALLGAIFEHKYFQSAGKRLAP